MRPIDSGLCCRSDPTFIVLQWKPNQPIWGKRILIARWVPIEGMAFIGSPSNPPTRSDLLFTLPHCLDSTFGVSWEPVAIGRVLESGTRHGRDSSRRGQGWTCGGSGRVKERWPPCEAILKTTQSLKSEFMVLGAFLLIYWSCGDFIFVLVWKRIEKRDLYKYMAQPSLSMIAPIKSPPAINRLQPVSYAWFRVSGENTGHMGRWKFIMWPGIPSW